jgi:hypothetical protein
VRWAWLILAQLAAQLYFTASIRLVVEPYLRSALHWQFGLTRASDSQFFYEEATSFRACLESSTWTTCTAAEPTPAHARLIGGIFHVLHSSNPWTIFLLNALLSCASAMVLSVILTTIGFEKSRSRVIATGLCLMPLWMFVHSELLREPFVVFSMFVMVLALSKLLGRGATGSGPRMQDVGFALALLVSYQAVVQLRSYLALPLFVALVSTVVLATIWQVCGSRSSRLGWSRIAVSAATLGATAVLVVSPLTHRLRVYSGSADLSPEVALLIEERWKAVKEARAEAAAGKRLWNHTDAAGLIAPCTIEWQYSGLLPRELEGKLLALSCVRQAFQRSCDVELLAAGADRNCDMAELKSGGEFVRHLPAAIAFGVLTPYPNMWIEGFGSGGTGLRRAGYVIDGVVAYLSLPGLILLWFAPPRTRTLATSLVAGLLVVLVIYAYSVPTQFILARMRMSMYTAILALGIAAHARQHVADSAVSLDEPARSQ